MAVYPYFSECVDLKKALIEFVSSVPSERAGDRLIRNISDMIYSLDSLQDDILNAR